MTGSAPVPWRMIALLSLASFAGAANLRISDTLLPLIASDFKTSIGMAAGIVAAFAISYGLMQAVYGPIADRGTSKITIVAAGSIAAGGATAACALAETLPALLLVRLIAGAAAAAVIPLAIAWIGDAVPFEDRQPVMARYLSGQLMGFLFGQAAGGAIGDAVGWRSAYVMLGAIHVVAGLMLLVDARQGPQGNPGLSPVAPGGGTLGSLRTLLADPWVRITLAAVGIEGAAMYGAFAYVGADLHQRLGLGLGAVGLILGSFGIGGLAYAWGARSLLRIASKPDFARAGGLLMAASFMMLAFAPGVVAAVLANALLGLAFYLLHNTLQVEATQMAPQARGLAIALFAASLFIFQSVGVALAGLVVDAYGVRPVYLAAALTLAAVGWWYASMLRRYR